MGRTHGDANIMHVQDHTVGKRKIDDTDPLLPPGKGGGIRKPSSDQSAPSGLGDLSREEKRQKMWEMIGTNWDSAFSGGLPPLPGQDDDPQGAQQIGAQYIGTTSLPSARNTLDESPFDVTTPADFVDRTEPPIIISGGGTQGVVPFVSPEDMTPAEKDAYGIASVGSVSDPGGRAGKYRDRKPKRPVKNPYAKRTDPWKNWVPQQGAWQGPKPGKSREVREQEQDAQIGAIYARTHTEIQGKMGKEQESLLKAMEMKDAERRKAQDEVARLTDVYEEAVASNNAANAQAIEKEREKALAQEKSLQEQLNKAINAEADFRRQMSEAASELTKKDKDFGELSEKFRKTEAEHEAWRLHSHKVNQQEMDKLKAQNKQMTDDALAHNKKLEDNLAAISGQMSGFKKANADAVAEQLRIARDLQAQKYKHAQDMKDVIDQTIKGQEGRSAQEKAAIISAGEARLKEVVDEGRRVADAIRQENEQLKKVIAAGGGGGGDPGGGAGPQPEYMDEGPPTGWTPRPPYQDPGGGGGGSSGGGGGGGDPSGPQPGVLPPEDPRLNAIYAQIQQIYQQNINYEQNTVNWETNTAIIEATQRRIEELAAAIDALNTTGRAQKIEGEESIREMLRNLSEAHARASEPVVAAAGIGGEGGGGAGTFGVVSAAFVLIIVMWFYLKKKKRR